MPVPVWSPIPDSMVAPEAPVSSDLMTRLRDQWASVFGYDPTAERAPAFTLPASKFLGGAASAFHARGTGATATSAEFVVSNVADPIEWIELAHDGADAHTGVLPYLNMPSYSFEIQLMEVIYSAGAPTGVRLRVSTADNTSRTAVDVTITTANTWQGVESIGPSPYHVLAAKCRVTSTQCFLQLRITPQSGSYYCGISIPFNLHTFASKA